MTVAIIGTMLTGGGRHKEAPDAVRSADKHVDHWALIDTGTSDEALAVICPIIGEGRYTVYRYPHAEFDCATARDFGLDCATACAELLYPGHEPWALVLDTDERMVIPDCVKLHPILEATTGNAVNVWDEGKYYTKERFIKLPPVTRYKGLAHEGYDSPEVHRDATDLIRFRELPKSKEELDRLTAWTLEACMRDLEMHPDEIRPLFYIAQAHGYFGRYPEAIEYYLRYAEKTPYDHEWGWAIFRAASCYNWMNELEKAIELCAKGLTRCPYMVEYYWMASYCELRRKNPLNALAWADAGIILGKTMAHVSPRPVRICFQLPESEWEGCWEHRREALLALDTMQGGDSNLLEHAKFANEMAEKAKKRRIGG